MCRVLCNSVCLSLLHLCYLFCECFHHNFFSEPGFHYVGSRHTFWRCRLTLPADIVSGYFRQPACWRVCQVPTLSCRLMLPADIVSGYFRQPACWRLCQVPTLSCRLMLPVSPHCRSPKWQLTMTSVWCGVRVGVLRSPGFWPGVGVSHMKGPVCLIWTFV